VHAPILDPLAGPRPGADARIEEQIPTVAFPELNLRTYVTAAGKPGVWFFSLDAGQKLAVRTARRLFHLPYFDAKFEINVTDEAVEYSSIRANRGSPQVRFAASYRSVGPVYRARLGSLEEWLTARFCLYAADRLGALYRGEIDHEPWPLQQAEADVDKYLGNLVGN
jgi:uncharacterized protein